MFRAAVRRRPFWSCRQRGHAATTASNADEARNTQTPDRRGSRRPRSSRDRSRRTVLGQRLRRLAARRPPHSRLLRRRWTHTASTTNRIGVSWVNPLPMSSRSKFRATQAVPVFPGTSELAFIPDHAIFTVPTFPIGPSQRHPARLFLCFRSASASMCLSSVRSRDEALQTQVSSSIWRIRPISVAPRCAYCHERESSSHQLRYPSGGSAPARRRCRERPPVAWCLPCSCSKRTRYCSTVGAERSSCSKAFRHVPGGPMKAGMIALFH